MFGIVPGEEEKEGGATLDAEGQVLLGAPALVEQLASDMEALWPEADWAPFSRGWLSRLANVRDKRLDTLHSYEEPNWPPLAVTEGQEDELLDLRAGDRITLPLHQIHPEDRAGATAKKGKSGGRGAGRTLESSSRVGTDHHPRLFPRSSKK